MTIDQINNSHSKYNNKVKKDSMKILSLAILIKAKNSKKMNNYY